jgi:hypothetical protein
MAKFKLAFGIHNHQPVGNFDSVFQQAHKDSYEPFLKLLENYPELRISLHQSGILWSWQQQHRPEYFDLVRKLVDRGQIELLTGGFYEPILTSIPARDVLGQIDMLTQYLKFQFNADATGLWLTERVWEPHLPQILNQAGVKFLPVDDTHFIFAGLQLEELSGPFVTEHEGATVTLLPIQKKLRYLIPFGTIDEVIAELRRQANLNPAGMAVYADDGEKFGVWPNTHKHCFDDGWLAQFFTALQKNSDWLEVVPLGRTAEMPAIGRVYIPSASYEEMLHWALPPRAFVDYEQFEKYLKDEGKIEQWGRFVRGSHWRAFLAKYDESNLMQKKMLSVSNKLHELEAARMTSSDRIAQIRDKLYASQCNCPYWHGVFGGLYLPHIRQAVYGNMVEADHLIRLATGATGVQMDAVDYDGDGHIDLVVNSNALSAVFRPTKGGALIDLAMLEHGFDPADTLTRRREGYHLKLDQAVTSASDQGTASIHDLVLAKEPGLKEYLVEDWYTKRSFIDHFFTPGTTLEGFKKGQFGEDGDFVVEPYRYHLDPATNSILLVRDGHVRRADSSAAVRISKRFVFNPTLGRIDVTYELVKLSGHNMAVQFAVENNFSFQAGHAADRFITIDGHRPTNSFLDSVGEHKSVNAVAMSDQYRGLGIGVVSDEPATIWHCPLFTVSLSEGGFEKVYQGTTLVHQFHLQLTEEPVRVRFGLHAGKMDEVQKHCVAPKLTHARL